jgi:hypothetical protein
MNPIFQAVIYRAVSDLNRRCHACGGRFEVEMSGRRERRKCDRCGADARQRRARGGEPRHAHGEGDSQIKRLFRWPSLRKGRAR